VKGGRRVRVDGGAEQLMTMALGGDSINHQCRPLIFQ
jgi:hypothetical protein